MTPKDLYCLKEGKLELSILDEEIIESEVEVENHIQEEKLDMDLKISEEIYNTLKTMGEFLTETEVSKPKVFPETTPLEDTEKTTQIVEIQDYVSHAATLQQSSIDTVLISHLGEVTPKFQYAMELKQKIDDEIKKIKDYRY